MRGGEWTPERRAMMAEKMRQQRNNPEFQAARLKALRETFAADAERGTIRRKISEANKEQWKDPAVRRKRLKAIMQGLDNGTREKRAALLAERRKDPANEEKRIAALRKKFAQMKAKKRAVAYANARKRRGFDVPARLWGEYRKLMDKRGMLAREAGIALGLVRE